MKNSEPVIQTFTSPDGKWIAEVEIDFDNQSFQIIWNESTPESIYELASDY